MSVRNQFEKFCSLSKIDSRQDAIIKIDEADREVNKHAIFYLSAVLVQLD